MEFSLIEVFECISISVTLVTFGLTLIRMWLEYSKSKNKNHVEKMQIIGSLSMAIFLALILIFLSFRLSTNLDTVVQSGSFLNYNQSTLTVYYERPFKDIPKLEFVKARMSDNYYSEPKILKQDKNSFTIEMNLGTNNYSWQATGLIE